MFSVSKLADRTDKNNVLLLREGQIDDTTITMLETYLTPEITSLCLCYTKLTDHSADYLSNILINHPQLTSLDLTGNQIGDPGLAILVKGIQQNPNLQKLVLDQNNIKDKGISVLINGLAKHRLLELSMRSNNIGLRGAKALANFLQENNTLKTLDLSDNIIGATGRMLLKKAIIKNTSLFSFSLCSEKKDPTLYQTIKKCCKRNQLFFDKNPITIANAHRPVVIPSLRDFSLHAATKTLFFLPYRGYFNPSGETEEPVSSSSSITTDTPLPDELKKAIIDYCPSNLRPK